tara:strand:- start:512 stop:1243 length:732 start_codon:yes stop_codon:yes gene_type:complete
MSDNESDCSIGTEELNELNNQLDEQIKMKEEKKNTPEPVIEKVEETVEDEPEKVVTVKKKKEMTQAQKDGLAKGRAKALENRKTKLVEKVISPVKKKIGRPPKSLEEKLAKQIITKEKIIYVIQDEDGNLIKKDPKKISMKEMKKIKAEEEAQKKEIELGKKLGRLKNGSAKIPKVRTEKQLEHTKRLMELNKDRRSGKVTEKKETTKKIVKEALLEIVTQPAPKKPLPPVKTAVQQYNDFFS